MGYLSQMSIYLDSRYTILYVYVCTCNIYIYKFVVEFPVFVQPICQVLCKENGLADQKSDRGPALSTVHFSFMVVGSGFCPGRDPKK